MDAQLEGFLLQIPDLVAKQPAELIEYFVYYLTVIKGEAAASPAAVEVCFNNARITKYSNISAYLSNHTRAGKSAPAEFVRAAGGYQLSRAHELELQKTLHTGPVRLETSHLLRSLLSKLTDANEKTFLQEAIDCYEIGARRGAVTLVWSLTLFHLFGHILAHKLADFNAELAANTDRRVRVTAVATIDDFSDIPEGKFLELARAARVISNDVRKILDTKLGIRNSYAHPSNVTISEVKATDFIIDLVDNVILKYPL